MRNAPNMKRLTKLNPCIEVIEPVKQKEDLEAIFHKLKAVLPRSKKATEYLKNRVLLHKFKHIHGVEILKLELIKFFRA